MFADVREFDPVDVLAVLARAWKRLSPEQQESFGPEAFPAVCLAYLTGMTPNATASKKSRERFALVEDVCFTIHLPGERNFKIGTMRGAINNLQFDTDEQACAAIERNHAALIGAAPGTKTDWFCPFCSRTWVAGTEPETCPDCDAHLMRARVPTPEDIEAMER